MQSVSSSIVENTLKKFDYVDPQNSTPFIIVNPCGSHFIPETQFTPVIVSRLKRASICFILNFTVFSSICYGKMARNSLPQQRCLGIDD